MAVWCPCCSWLPLWHGLRFDLSEIHGVSPWGASTLAGADGSRQPSQLELKCALKHGQVFGNAVKRTVAKGSKPQVQSGRDLLQHVP